MAEIPPMLFYVPRAHKSHQEEPHQHKDFKKYVPKFLLPAEESQPTTRIYDSPLRRGLFHHHKEGNEHTVSARRNSEALKHEQKEEKRRRSVDHAGLERNFD